MKSKMITSSTTVTNMMPIIASEYERKLVAASLNPTSKSFRRPPGCDGGLAGFFSGFSLSQN